MQKNVLKALEEKLGDQNILTGEKLNDRYSHIWEMDKPLNAKAVLFPKSTIEISQILKICSAFQQSVVVHGGLTNLVGSTECSSDDIVIAMEKMNSIEEFDELGRTIIVQAGVILEHIHQLVEEKDLLFPMTFGAKGSAQIGGVISTNAGGLRVFRYGMTRNLILGLEVVLADGTVISSMKKVIKDNSGYDLKHLFIGSEGTLGVITRAVLKLQQKPKSRNSAFVSLNDYKKVLELLRFVDSALPGVVSGYEILWERNFIAMTSQPSMLSPPLPYGYSYYILLETLGGNQNKDYIDLENILAEAFEKEIILDAAIAQSSKNQELFWQIREDVDVLVSQCKNVQNFDVSLPVSEIGNYVDLVFEKLDNIPEVENYFAHGHVADGNIHFLVGKMHNDASLTKIINNIVYEPIKKLGGSISAEHGIGLHKKEYVSFCRTEEEIDLMKRLKHSMDPKNILNRNKIL